jgi:hypothetical protein
MQGPQGRALGIGARRPFLSRLLLTNTSCGNLPENLAFGVAHCTVAGRRAPKTEAAVRQTFDAPPLVEPRTPLSGYRFCNGILFADDKLSQYLQPVPTIRLSTNTIGVSLLHATESLPALSLFGVKNSTS